MKITEETLKKKAEFHKKYIKTKEFEEVRNAVLDRDGHKCVICGRTENLVCHHTTYRHLGQHNLAEIADCITLCQLDHLNHHRGKYNIHWYSTEHPRNNDDLREVEYWGLKILVRSNGEDLFDALTYKKLNVYKNKNRGGRASVFLNDKTIYVHRLIAKAFPEICGEWFEGCEVHHIDRNVHNNMPENLKVMTPEEHQMIHNDEFVENAKKVNETPVYQYTLSGNYIAKWESSVIAAERLGLNDSAIRNVIAGISSTSGGYMWRHFEEDEEIPLWIEPILSGNERAKLKLSVKISQYTKDGEWIQDWVGLDEPTKVYGGKSKSAISNCLKGKSKSAFGFVWRYKE